MKICVTIVFLMNITCKTLIYTLFSNFMFGGGIFSFEENHGHFISVPESLKNYASFS